MGGWLVSSILCLPDMFDYVNHHLAFRGPDAVAKFAWHRVGFTHHTIHAAKGRKHPAQAGNQTVYSVVDGRIYNCEDFESSVYTHIPDDDSECVIAAYKQHGANFVTHLKGDFSLAMLDFEADLMVAATDTFGTKPLFWTIDDGEFGLSSCDSPLSRLGLRNRARLPANTALYFSIKMPRLVEKSAN